jgi:hypothetical protein
MVVNMGVDGGSDGCEYGGYSAGDMSGEEYGIVHG